MGLLDMTPDQADAMMGLGMGLLSASGPSRAPVGFGQALAGGMQGFQQAQQYARQKKMQDDAVAMQQDRFSLEKSYKDLQEQQMRASLAQAERAQAAQDAFMKQFGTLMTPQPQQQPSFDPSNFNMEQATPETYIKPAQMLLARKQAGGRLSPEQENFLSTVQSAIRQPPAAQQPDMGQVAALSAFGQLAGVKGASGLMEYAKFNSPDWQQVDNGGSIQFVNKKGGQMPVIAKTMSPDAIAANQLGWANNDVARFNATKSTYHDGALVSPTGEVTKTPMYVPPKGSPEATAQASAKVLPLIDQANKLLNKATGSYGGAAYDAAAAAFGRSTEGAQAAAQLKAIEGALMMAQPRMEGPQSDKDVALYRQMSAQIGDSTVPVETRRAALMGIKSLHEKYAAPSSSL